MRQFEISRKSKEQREEKLPDVDYSVLKNTDFCYIPYLCTILFVKVGHNFVHISLAKFGVLFAFS